MMVMMEEEEEEGQQPKENEEGGEGTRKLKSCMTVYDSGCLLDILSKRSVIGWKLFD